MLQRVIWIICLPLHWELLPISQGKPAPPVHWHDTEIQELNNCLYPGLDTSQHSGQHQMKSSKFRRSPILILHFYLSLSLSLCNYFLWGSSSNKYFSTSLGWLLMSPTYWGSPNDQPSNHQSQFYSICSQKIVIVWPIDRLFVTIIFYIFSITCTGSGLFFPGATIKWCNDLWDNHFNDQSNQIVIIIIIINRTN